MYVRINNSNSASFCVHFGENKFHSHIALALRSSISFHYTSIEHFELITLCWNWCHDEENGGNKKIILQSFWNPQFICIATVRVELGLWSHPVVLVRVVELVPGPDLLLRCQMEPVWRATLATFVLFGICLKKTEMFGHTKVIQRC